MPIAVRSDSAPPSRDVRHMVETIRYPKKGDLVLAAHRGFRWNGTTENSKASIRRTAEAGFICVEIDIQMTADHVPILMHDPTLGRSTNIGEYLGRDDVYSPFTGQGYSPQVKDLPWSGCIDQLKLKDEHGNIHEEGVLTFKGLLDFIEEESIEIVIFMDIKDKDAIPIMYELTKGRANGSGIPAIEWCVWKLFCHFYPSPVELEAAEWWQDAVKTGNPVYIPVYEPFAAKKIADPLASCKAFSLMPQTMSLEIGLRCPGGYLQDLLDYAIGVECPVKSLGFFAALGDLWPFDGEPILFDTGSVEVPWQVEKQVSPLGFLYTCPPQTMDQLLGDGDSPDGHDHRDDLREYRDLGFTWTIADRGAELRKKGLITA